MHNSNLLPKWNLSEQHGTLWKAGVLLFFLALIICVPSLPMHASRSGFAPAAAQQAIACGQVLTGNITAAGQQVSYTFAGQANERKTLTLTASGFPFGATATATVISPAAVTVATFDANSQRQLTLTESGTYVIQVRANNLVSTGSYSLGLECLLPTSPVDATLVCGGLLSDRPINAASQVDQITFAGQANERKTLTLTASGFPFGATATATIFSPAAVVVTTFDANSQRQLTLPESGTYVIQVRANNLVSTGSYSIGLECLLPTSPVDATLACGGLLARSINAASQVDQITFAGQANERKTLTLTASGFPFGATATATVFSPAAVVVVTFDANDQRQLTLTESGTYVIQVRANNLVSTGSYSIGLECLLPTSPVDATLVCGALLSERPINASAQVDQIAFTGQANQRVTLTLTAGGFPFGATATATVFSPAAVVVTTFDANSQRQLALTASGTYVIQVRANNLVSTGAYSIGLECLLPTSPVDATLPCGALLSDRPINAAAQVDQFTFTGQANERKTLTLTASGFPFGATATATVFSPTGVMVATFDANSQRQLTLTESGTYVIQVRANNLVSTGSYSIGLECLLPTSPVDATLVCGGLLPRSINAAAQVDQVTFSGQANQRVTLTLTASGFPFGATATATVFSPTAVMVVTFDANGQRQLTLTESGTYVIQVRANNLVSTGAYSIGLECLQPPITLTPNPLTITAGARGNLTVTISPSQNTATAVTLSSSNPAFASVQSSITIQANAASAIFEVTGVAPGTATITATLPASLGGGSATASVTVQPGCLPNSVLPSGFRPFSQIYYLTGANAGGDRLAVGIMPPAQRQQLNAVPLPNQLNQRFCDPVELAPGLLAIAYVPTAGERNGDFSSFAGLLLDPVNNAPFPNGIIPANRLGDPHAWRIVNQIGGPAFVSAASYSAVELASECIVAAFGSRLATETRVAPSLPLPTVLQGSTVKVRDSAGVERLAGIFFVSPDQINFQVPPGTVNGIATVTITSGNGSVSIGTMQIATVAPGLFAANANGRDVAAGVALRVKADGTQVFESIARFDQAQGKFVSVPIDLGPEGEQVFLILFGTGIRFRGALTAVTTTIGGTNSEVLFAGAAPGFVGLDQANVRLSRSLIGRGEMDVALTVDGKMANSVRVNIR